MDQRRKPELTLPITFDIYLAEEEIAEKTAFPPRRFWARDRRLHVLEMLWHGDFSEFDIGWRDHADVTVNIFQNYATRVANMLTAVNPSVDGLTDGLYQAIIDLSRYGGAILCLEDGELSCMDPLTWYPLDGDAGHVFVTPYISIYADQPIPDRAEVLIVDADGAAELRVYGWEETGIDSAGGYSFGGTTLGNGQFSNLIESDTDVMKQVSVVRRAPNIGHAWGTAKFLEVASPTIEIARRLSRNSRVLDLNGRPVPVFREADVDTVPEWDYDPDSTTERERRDLIHDVSKGNIDFLQQEGVRLPDNIQDFKFESPNVEGVRVSLEQVERMKDEIAAMTGLPSLSGEWNSSSGESLKRQLLPFYVETLALQNLLIDGLAEVGVNIEWPHLFDEMEAASVEQQQMMAESMADGNEEGDEDEPQEQDR